MKILAFITALMLIALAIVAFQPYESCAGVKSAYKDLNHSIDQGPSWLDDVIHAGIGVGTAATTDYFMPDDWPSFWRFTLPILASFTVGYGLEQFDEEKTNWGDVLGYVAPAVAYKGVKLIYDNYNRGFVLSYNMPISF